MAWLQEEQSRAEERSKAQNRYLSHTTTDDARREWEVYRYLQPLQDSNNTPGYASAPTCGEGVSDGNPSAPAASHDLALTAFAQLGALRLNCRRAIISLLDRRHQYVIAEATRTLSLQNDQIHDDDDGLWLGQVTFDRGNTPCGYAAGLLIPPQIESSDNETGKGAHDYVAFPNIQEVPMFANHPLTWSPKPNGRFYAGVPIITPDGYNIGVYCVLDDKPRDGLTSSEVTFLKDMSATVMSHLVMARAKDELQHSQQMVRGLSKFQDCQSSDNTSTPSSTGPTTKSQKGHTRCTSSNKNRDPDTTSTSNVHSTCQRAAEIIRNVASFDGVVLLDASITSYSSQESNTRARTVSATNPGLDGISPIADVSSATGINQVHEDYAAVLGCSLANRPGNSALPEVKPPSSLRGDFVQTLLRKYPMGKIWTDDQVFDAESEGHKTYSPVDLITSSSALEEYAEIKILRDLFPGFHSLALVGLRHGPNSRWFAASFAWTCSPTRVLSQDSELAYLVAFGSTIMSELARLDVKVADQAKTAFISSISHELRTPLHGIMGSLECLQNTQMDGFQADLLNTIDTCNQTLLDIFDNLLSFASIDQLVKKDKWDSLGPASSPALTKKTKPAATPSSSVDLRVMIEGVIETILAGRRFVHNSGKHNAGAGSNFDASRGAVNLLLEFDDAESSRWTFYTQPGGWRRLILNLVTNALKYTSSGSISVHLTSKPLPDQRGQGRSHVTMTVIDTGKGMSPEFLRLQLFNPFSQEDSFAPGTGLGLSICKEIVTSMGGDISVTSEQNQGTKFEISVILDHSSQEVHQGSMAPVFSPLSGKLSKNHLRIGRISASQHQRPLTARGDMESLFTKQCVGWLGLSTSISSDTTDDDLIILSEDEAQMLKVPLFKPMIVIRNMYSGSEFKLPNDISPHVECLTQPWTPAKLARVISGCLEAHDFAPKSSAQYASLSQSTATSHVLPPSPASSPTDVLPVSESSAAPATPDVSVLLVDDNPINVQLLATFMKKQKYHYDIAVNGQEAVSLYQSFNAQQIDGAAKKSYHYILMDINMPVMDGIEATRKIRDFETSAGLAPSSIIMLTGAGSQEVQQEAFASGANLFLTKPVRLKQLGKMLQDLA